MTNEQEILKRCIKGDNRALTALYDRYAPKLLGVCLRYVPAKSDAEDILQDAFIKILKNLKRFEYRGEGSVEGWMRRIVVNSSLNFLRDREKNMVLVESMMPADVEAGDEDDVSPRVSPEEIIRLIQQLPAGYRTVLNLFVFEHYSHKEISVLLNCSESNSKSQLLRARMLLKKNMMQFIANKEFVPVYEKQ